MKKLHLTSAKWVSKIGSKLSQHDYVRMFYYFEKKWGDNFNFEVFDKAFKAYNGNPTEDNLALIFLKTDSKSATERQRREARKLGCKVHAYLAELQQARLKNDKTRAFDVISLDDNDIKAYIPSKLPDTYEMARKHQIILFSYKTYLTLPLQYRQAFLAFCAHFNIPLPLPKMKFIRYFYRPGVAEAFFTAFNNSSMAF